MNQGIAVSGPISADDDRIAAAVAAQGPRLRAFVRRQIADLSEVEDIVQDTFVELVSAYRFMEPIEHLAAWLLRVARNRIIDRFRERSRAATVIDSALQSDAIPEQWLVPSAQGPEADYQRELLAEELLAALDELPAQQREIFVAHELEGRSFEELSAQLGVGVNTLLGRKHAAVRYLRQRLRGHHSEFDN
jgi:RNA polymerase sigma factor (sigma-70 family)